jgi:hypothetical protein
MSRASRKEARQERLRLEEEERKAEALSRPRSWYEDLSYRGVGLLVVQVLYHPAFEPCVCWEIRWDGQSDTYAVYRSESESPDRLVGYERLQASAEELEAFLERLYRISVPVAVPLDSLAVLDGSTYGIALSGGIQSRSRFLWRGEAVPAAWKDLADCAESMVAYFRHLVPET